MQLIHRMVRTTQFFAFAAWLVLALTPSSVDAQKTCPRIKDKESLKRKLIDAWSSSSLLIMMRHTDKYAGNAPPILRECKEKSQTLTAKGGEQAGKLKILIEQASLGRPLVYSSDFCRTIQTAEIVFGSTDKPIKVEPRLGEEECSADGVKNIVATAIARPSNLVLVTHSNCLRNFFDTDFNKDHYLGVSLAFDTKESEDWLFIGCIRRDDWKQLSLED